MSSPQFSSQRSRNYLQEHRWHFRIEWLPFHLRGTRCSDAKSAQLSTTFKADRPSSASVPGREGGIQLTEPWSVVTGGNGTRVRSFTGVRRCNSSPDSSESPSSRRKNCGSGAVLVGGSADIEGLCLSVAQRHNILRNVSVRVKGFALFTCP